MPLIIIIIMAIYLVLIAWTWQSLGNIDKIKKVVLILIGIVLSYIITLIVFNLSKSGIDYGNISTKDMMKTLLISTFTGINGIIILPYISKLLSKINDGEIDKDIITKRLIIFVIIFAICMYFECGYLRNAQKEMINIYNSTYEENNTK